MTFSNVLGSGINGSQFVMMPSIFSVSSYSLLIFVPYSFFFYFRSRAHMYSLFFNVKLFLSDAPALNNPYSFGFFKTLFDIHYSASTPEFQAETWGVSIIEI